MVVEVDWAQPGIFHLGSLMWFQSEGGQAESHLTHVSGAWVGKTRTAGALGRSLSVSVWSPSMAASGKLGFLGCCLKASK